MPGVGVHTRDESDGIVRVEKRGRVFFQNEFDVRELFESGGVFLEPDESIRVCERVGSAKVRGGWAVRD